MDSHSVSDVEKGAIKDDSIVQKTAHGTPVLIKGEIEMLPQATRTPAYDYLRRRKAAVRRRNRQKKQILKMKRYWDILQWQDKRQRALEKQAEDLRRTNDELIPRVINVLSSPNLPPEKIQYIKELLAQLRGGWK